MTYMATPYLKNPCVRGIEICNFCRFFLVTITIDFSLSDLYLGIERKMFKKIHAFYYVTYMITHNPGSFNLHFL